MPLHSDYLATQTGCSIAVGSGLTGWLVSHSDLFAVLGVIFGLLIGISGFIFQLRRDRRERELHAKRMNDFPPTH